MSHPESSVNKFHTNKEASQILMKINFGDFYILKFIEMIKYASSISIPLMGIKQLLRFNHVNNI